MRYLLMIYSQELPGGPLPSEVESIMQGHRAVMEDSGKSGALLGYEKLKASATATTVRMKDGAAIITDGPFAETKEQLAGYYIMDCANLDEAIEWAKRIPTVCQGGVGGIEIRPIHELPRRA
jgi:hypothetical protein